MAEASSSSAPQPGFRGFSPPAWIFSYPQQQPEAQIVEAAAHFLPTPLPPPQPARRYGLGSRLDLGEGEDDEFTAYGPQLRRKGNVRFVKAKGLGAVDAGDKGGKGKERDVGAEDAPKDKGNSVRGLYESIVGLQPTPAATPTPPRRPTPPPPDVDLTLDSGEDSDDDLIVLDPATGLPAPPPPRIKRLRPKRRPPSAIHDLLPADLTNPHVPPIHYGIKPSNIGWRMLAKQGWVEGQCLGPAEAEEREGTVKRLKVPLQGVEKWWEGQGPKKTREEREEERRRQERIEKERRGRGSRGMTKQHEREGRERKEMIAYMNR
ncbi:hypothetical protein BCR35DRAFT_305578 [Leucosporidium creatinivorum]|uniref:G-patch domain-containing protein n=1 Tax=Leucosporidium creatinivorum TaxID=106004 RepID=A0A1Y2F0A5_9BASI|nr:hypothetical protein BCR35DRAFT_305578 [Leucosporidium creatinivorum]